MKDTRTCIPNVMGKEDEPTGMGEHRVYTWPPDGIYNPYNQLAEVHVKQGDAVRLILLDKEGNGYSSIYIRSATVDGGDIDIDISNWHGEHTVKMFVPISRLKKTAL